MALALNRTGVVFKKCDRANHKAESNKACAAGTCQHTCSDVERCAHAWTLRYRGTAFPDGPPLSFPRAWGRPAPFLSSLLPLRVIGLDGFRFGWSYGHRVSAVRSNADT